MSESDYDSANEYTSLMDGHVESRTDDVILGNEHRRKGRSRNTSEEVIFCTVLYTHFFSFLLNFAHNKLLTRQVFEHCH